MAAAATVSPDMLVGFVQLVKKFSNDPCFQKVKDLMDEQSTLRADLGRLQTAFEVNLKYLEAERQKVTELQNQLTDERATIQSLTVAKEEVETEVAEFRRNLEESTAKRQEQQKALEHHKEENGILKKQRDNQKKELDAERSSKEFAERKLRSVEQDLSDAKDSLAASNKELGRHKNLAPPLKELSKEDVISVLQMIFQSVEHLVKSHFWVDIDEKNLKKFLTHDAMKGIHDIPLPLSNSSAAKNMRVAVAMKVLGSAMVDRIFTPVHLGDESNEFDNFLLDSVVHDPERAATLRSLVLKISDDNPDHTHEERAESVATGAMDCLRLLLPPDEVNTVTTALETICAKAIERWARLQWNTNVILPLTAAPSTPSEQRCWLPLRLLETGEAVRSGTPQSKPSATSGKTRQVSNGSVSGSQPRATQVNGSSTNNKTSTGKAANHKPDDGSTAGTALAARPSIAVDDVASVVWPAFYSIKDQRNIRIQPGFVLTTAQVAAAQQESTDQRQSGHHRDMRQGSRRRSLAATSQKNGSAGPTDFFLSEDGNEQETG